MFSPHQRIIELREEENRLYKLWYINERGQDTMDILQGRTEFRTAKAMREGYELALSDLKEILST